MSGWTTYQTPFFSLTGAFCVEDYRTIAAIEPRPVEYIDIMNQPDEEKTMNYTTAVFLINKHVRAVVATYERDDTGLRDAKRTTFKTLDQTIRVGDLVVVPTDTRHKMTVVKIVETDVDVDFNSSVPIDWIVCRVDDNEYKITVEKEESAVSQIKSAEIRKRREEMRDALFADREALKALPLASMNGDSSA